MFLLFISFIGGVLTVLAPCVLPLLPVIVGGSLSDGAVHKKKAFVVVGSLAVSVIVFTLILKVSTLFIMIPEYVWTIISGGIITILGLVTLFPGLLENKFLNRLNVGSNKILGQGLVKENFWGNVIIGASLGPVFSTCSPTYFIVLATVLPAKPILGMIYLIAYTIGLSVALLAVTFVGQKIVDKLGVVADSRGIFKKVLGIIFLAVGIAIIFGLDKKIETVITGAGFFDVTKVEQKLLEQNNNPTIHQDPQKIFKYKLAPELVSPDGFINTDGKPITLAELKGKVVLLDIWTYSCINCQRTLPYVTDWYQKYHDQGLEIIGIHTPEFAFEKVQSNVEKAVQKFGIKYPVILDNEYKTWNALGNSYWPRKYLVDMDGFIVYDHIGEGNYAETEQAIQRALQERAERLGMQETISTDVSIPKDAVTVEQGKVNSAETYFGSNRNNGAGNKQLTLNGSWNILPEYAENGGPASIVYNYDAKNVYFAAGSSEGSEVSIYVDDVLVKTLSIKDQQLYQVVQGNDYGKHVLRIEIPKAGLQAFTFTFG